MIYRLSGLVHGYVYKEGSTVTLFVCSIDHMDSGPKWSKNTRKNSSRKKCPWCEGQVFEDHRWVVRIIEHNTMTPVRWTQVRISARKNRNSINAIFGDGWGQIVSGKKSWSKKSHEPLPLISPWPMNLKDSLTWVICLAQGWCSWVEAREAPTGKDYKYW